MLRIILEGDSGVLPNDVLRAEEIADQVELQNNNGHATAEDWGPY